MTDHDARIAEIEERHKGRSGSMSQDVSWLLQRLRDVTAEREEYRCLEESAGLSIKMLTADRDRLRAELDEACGLLDYLKNAVHTDMKWLPETLADKQEQTDTFLARIRGAK